MAFHVYYQSRKCPIGLLRGQCYGHIFSTEAPSSQMTIAHGKSTKTNQTKPGYMLSMEKENIPEYLNVRFMTQTL